MELGNKYLTYAEYKELGGALEEAPFNILEFKAQNYIDLYTFGRLKNLEQQNNEVKMCIYDLISLGNAQTTSLQAQSKGITSESIDGYSVSYGEANIGTLQAHNEAVKNTIKLYLADCKLNDGTPYLYVGADAKC